MSSDPEVFPSPYAGLTEGRIVHYVLDQRDCETIRARRAITAMGLPHGVQPSLGNPVSPGEHVPAMVVRVWPNEFGNNPGVNLQVFLDGNDQLWATSVKFSLAPSNGTYHWPERA